MFYEENLRSHHADRNCLVPRAVDDVQYPAGSSSDSELLGEKFKKRKTLKAELGNGTAGFVECSG